MNEDKIILYIEDDPEARFLMADIVRYKGYIYLEASRGLEGIRMAEKYLPDLILIDLILPDIQGYEVTTHLKNNPKLADTPIIALSAETQKDVKEMVLTAGCDGYIPKPINVSEFVFKIEAYLAGHKDTLEPEDERLYLQRYNIRLVNRLKKKISELENLNENLSTLNSELFSSKEELAQYNDRLFYLNNLANFLRALDDPNALLEILPSKAVEAFQIKRCILFDITTESEQLKPIASSGMALSEIPELQFSTSAINQLRRKGGVLWIRDLAEIIEPAIEQFAQKLGCRSFLIGNLAEMGTERNISAVFKTNPVEAETVGQSTPSRKVLIFLDKGKEGANFHTYEIRIIKSFFHSLAIIHENLLLHTKLLELYKIKSEQAIRDELTSAYNYRYFTQELEREINRSKRFETHFSVMMLDIDHFKKYNDTHGHLEGDRVLKLVSQLMVQNTRTTDTIARYGGEEFTIIMPGLLKSAAVMIAEKLRELIETYQFNAGAQSTYPQITVSIGVSSYPEDSVDSKKLLKLADMAMYRAKSGGRNQVCSS